MLKFVKIIPDHPSSFHMWDRKASQLDFNPVGHTRKRLETAMCTFNSMIPQSYSKKIIQDRYRDVAIRCNGNKCVKRGSKVRTDKSQCLF